MSKQEEVKRCIHATEKGCDLEKTCDADHCFLYTIKPVESQTDRIKPTEDKEALLTDEEIEKLQTFGLRGVAIPALHVEAIAKAQIAKLEKLGYVRPIGELLEITDEEMQKIGEGMTSEIDNSKLFDNESEPTTEQKWQSVLERCGFKLVPRFGGTDMIETLWQSPENNHSATLPPLTLDNLFKWAVPKLQGYRISVVRQYDNWWVTEIYNAENDGIGKGKNVKTALLQAIWEVIPKEK